MASEASWQTAGVGSAAGARAPASMDQRSIEGLLLKLVERVTESERRYGEALEDLHARLDRLSQAADTARGTATPGTGAPDAEALDRLHDRIGNLARRLGEDVAAPLDDFERLGRTLSQGMRAAASMDEPGVPRPRRADPGGTAYARRADYGVPEPEIPYAAAGDRDVARRLMEAAHRLERSISAAMPAAAIETLNARLDELGIQLNETLARTPTREGLRQVQRQIAEMGQQIGRAERQLAKLGTIESQLIKLIARLDEKPMQTKPVPLQSAQIEEVARKAAAEAARLAVEEGKSRTSQRLDAMQRDLNAVSDRNRQSNDLLAGKIQEVHEALKRLAQKVEQSAPAPAAKPRSPFVEAARTGSEPLLSRSETPDQKDLGSASAHKSALLPKTDRAKPGPAPKDTTDTDGGMGRRGSESGPDAAVDTPPDLIAAARRGARAASLRDDEKAQVTVPVAERKPRRMRSLLIVAAAILLAISAALLYERLRTEPRQEVIRPAPTHTAPASADPAPTTAAPAPKGEAPPAPPSGAAAPDLEQPNAWTPLPETNRPAAASEPRKVGSVTEISKSTHLVSAETVAGLPEGLPSGEFLPLPPGVVLTLQVPKRGAQTKTMPQTMPASLSLPPAELGPLSLRQAAAEGNAKAQYVVALRYTQGKGIARDLDEARRWLDRAASAGFAPAQYKLGALYERGEGVDKDLARARSWYKAAAEKGNVKAMHNLAISESRREDAAADFEEAARWHEEAAAHGFADSQFNLGMLYEHGLGRPQDPVQAYKWFALAALSGDADAAKQRDRIESALDSGSLADAVRAVKAWEVKPRNAEANDESGTWEATAKANAELVMRAQAMLNRLGYDVGAPDGLMGARTRAAIKSFERQNGLGESGEVSVPLVIALERLTG